MGTDHDIFSSSKTYAMYSSNTLDDLYPELAGYDSYESTPYTPPGDSIALGERREQSPLLSEHHLSEGAEPYSPNQNPSVPAEYLLIESLSGDVAASFGPSSPSDRPSEPEYFAPKESRLGMYSFSDDLYKDDYSGQLF